jgi:hypothetical protein
MTRFWIKLISLLCALMMIMSAAVACAEQNEDEKTPDDSTQEGETGDNQSGDKDSDEIVYTAKIPDGYSCNGETFTVYTYPQDVFVWKDYDWQNSGDITGDRINDAVFRRTAQVEEELDVTIEYYCGESYSNPTDFIKTVTTGEDAFDIANVNMRSHISQVTQGLLTSIPDMQQLDYEAAWWDQNVRRDLAIYDKFFCLTGDIGTMYKRSIGTILFNKQMISEYSLEMPYDMAVDGTWTIETMIEMAEDVPADLDGNDKMDKSDRYSIIYFDGVFETMMIGAGVQYATRDDDGIPQLSIYSDHSSDVLDLMADLLYDPDTSYNVYRFGQNEETMWEIFMDNRALFYYGELHSAEDMRATEYEFGIMPMPKFDEYQESYRHTINAGVAAVIVIPKTNTRLERTAYVLDSLGAASKNILTPAYYDINLKGIISKDEESTVSLDIIISTMAYDVGFMYISHPSTMLRKMGRNFSTNLASESQSIETPSNAEIEKIINAIETHY